MFRGKAGDLANTYPFAAFHPTSRSSALSKFAMPAMSPTMTEGGIASWKKQEGDSFSAGDVLVEIETDKATIDVEAQDDGVLIKIIVSYYFQAKYLCERYRLCV